MVSQCANPGCGKPFLYLRDGKLFATSRRNGTVEESRIEYFWLCAGCAPVMSLVATVDGHMDLVPRNRLTVRQTSV